MLLLIRIIFVIAWSYLFEFILLYCLDVMVLSFNLKILKLDHCGHLERRLVSLVRNIIESSLWKVCIRWSSLLLVLVMEVIDIDSLSPTQRTLGIWQTCCGQVDALAPIPLNSLLPLRALCLPNLSLPLPFLWLQWHVKEKKAIRGQRVTDICSDIKIVQKIEFCQRSDFTVPPSHAIVIKENFLL